MKKDSKEGKKEGGYVHNVRGRNSFNFETQIFPEETKLENDTPLPGVLASVQGVNESTCCEAVLEQGAFLE